MKLLREAIRRLILQEGMITPSKLPNNIGVAVKFTTPYEANVQYCIHNDDGTLGELLAMPSPAVDGIHGLVRIIQAVDPYTMETMCNDAWVVDIAMSANGYGPLLYDIAIEIATMKGGGLVSDRGSVSPEARKVWNHYLKNRPDVEAIQCDDMKNTLTPDSSDNMEMSSAKFSGGESWIDSPLSKRYVKKNTRIRELGDRLHIIKDY